MGYGMIGIAAVPNGKVVFVGVEIGNAIFAVWAGDCSVYPCTIGGQQNMGAYYGLVFYIAYNARYLRGLGVGDEVDEEEQYGV